MSSNGPTATKSRRGRNSRTVPPQLLKPSARSKNNWLSEVGQSAILQPILQVVIVVLIAFLLFAVVRFRDFIFSTILGGLVALVMRPSRTEQGRNAAERERKERIRE